VDSLPHVENNTKTINVQDVNNSTSKTANKSDESLLRVQNKTQAVIAHEANNSTH
jgi:hypothetical protein